MIQNPARGNDVPGSAPGYLYIEVAPNCSLTARGAVGFVAVVAIATFSVAIFFTAQGFWPVLPFAGLEIALLAWAVRASMRDGQRRERITIDDRSIVIESNDPRKPEPSVFPRHWAKVKLHGPQAASYPSRLTIESHGRVREVGRFLTDDQRRALASRLKQLVGNVDESPSLG